DGERIERGARLAEWDPFTVPILTEVGGIVKYGDIIDGVTVEEAIDEATGLSRKVVVESRATNVRPRVSIKDEKGKTKKLLTSENAARYFMPVGANLYAIEGEE